MKHRKLFLLALLSAFPLVLGASSAAAQSYCRESEESEESVRVLILRLVMEVGDRDRAFRTAVLPRLEDSSEVYFILDEEKCLKAARAVAAAFGDDTVTPPPVHVLRVGPTRYLAYNYRTNGRSFYFPVLDDQFRYISSLG